MALKKAAGAFLAYFGYVGAAMLLPVIVALYVLKIGLDLVFVLLEKLIERYTDLIGWMLK